MKAVWNNTVVAESTEQVVVAITASLGVISVRAHDVIIPGIPNLHVGTSATA